MAKPRIKIPGLRSWGKTRLTGGRLAYSYGVGTNHAYVIEPSPSHPKFGPIRGYLLRTLSPDGRYSGYATHERLKTKGEAVRFARRHVKTREFTPIDRGGVVEGRTNPPVHYTVVQVLPGGARVKRDFATRAQVRAHLRAALSPGLAAPDLYVLDYGAGQRTPANQWTRENPLTRGEANELRGEAVRVRDRGFEHERGGYHAAAAYDEGHVTGLRRVADAYGPGGSGSFFQGGGRRENPQNRYGLTMHTLYRIPASAVSHHPDLANALVWWTGKMHELPAGGGEMAVFRFIDGEREGKVISLRPFAVVENRRGNPPRRAPHERLRTLTVEPQAKNYWRNRWENDEVEVDVWEERDNLTIRVVDRATDKQVAAWTDDDARQLFEDGFFRRQPHLEQSVVEYLDHLGVAPGSARSYGPRRNPPNPLNRREAVQAAEWIASRQRDVVGSSVPRGDQDYLQGRVDGMADVAHAYRPYEGPLDPRGPRGRRNPLSPGETEAVHVMADEAHESALWADRNHGVGAGAWDHGRSRGILQVAERHGAIPGAGYTARRRNPGRKAPSPAFPLRFPKRAFESATAARKSALASLRRIYGPMLAKAPTIKSARWKTTGAGTGQWVFVGRKRK